MITGSRQEVSARCFLPEGTRLKDRYVIEKVLGAGGFGITYEAFDMLLNRNVAVKEFYVGDCMERNADASLIVKVKEDTDCRKKAERSLENFHYETRAMKALQNVHYVSRIRDDFAENNTEYIVMELLRGRTLSEYHRKNIVINSREIMEAVEHVLIALEEMHSLGFIHRDISPGNLFFTDDGDLYLIDFGTATSIEAGSEYANEQIFEHKGFHAPEYNIFDRQGPWTDIYSLCATLVYLLTDEAVPDENSRRISDPVPGLLMRSKLSARQQNILLKGLNEDIAKRVASARELRLALCGEIEELDETISVNYCASTDIGSRKSNQDNLIVDGLFYYEGTDFVKSGELVCHNDELHLVAVCDGVGGANCGDFASRAAVQALNHFLEQYRKSDVLPERLIDELLDQINEKIISLGRKIGRTGTTLAMLLWKGNQYYSVNIGDSPIHLLRRHKLEQLSEAQTLALAKMMVGMPYTPGDNHTLMNYVGKEKVAGSHMAYVRHGYIKQGDTFYICSDGVTDKIDRDRLKRYLSRSVSGAVQSIQRTLKRYSNNDNCTGIVIRFM